MRYFQTYVSNSLAGSSNQKFFESDRSIHTGRIFYKVFCGGEYEYAFLFGNTIDSTFADGVESYNNLICDSWTIKGMRVAICDQTSNNIPEEDFCVVTFDDKVSKEVMPGDIFATDSVCLKAMKNSYICVEITFCGSQIPHHHENLIPAFIKEGDTWRDCNQIPFVSMVGCQRKVNKKIAFLGDSITQGIGTTFNSYAHWNAIVSELLGEENAYWNLGIGYGRASDAASDGAWMHKAKQNDLVVVCFGVNDLIQLQEEEQIKKDLRTIVEKLKAQNIKVILQTIPPFDYAGAQVDKWNRMNCYIKNELSALVDMVFDVVPILCKDTDNAHVAKYGPHPNEDGCKAWAYALYSEMKDIITDD